MWDCRIGHDVLTRDEAVGGAREEQIHQRQQDEREGEDAGEEEDPEEQDHVVERVEDGPGSERREVRELGEKEEEGTLAGSGRWWKAESTRRRGHVVTHEGQSGHGDAEEEPRQEGEGAESGACFCRRDGRGRKGRRRGGGRTRTGW